MRQSTNVRAIAALEGARSLYPAGVQLTRFDAASFRNGIQLLVAPKPGLRLRRFDTALTTLDDLHEVAPADERVVADVALPKDRPGDNFALVFDGYLEVPQDGIYTFSLFSDDGSRLSIGGTQIVDRDGGAVWEQRQGRIALRAGWHLFHLTYFEAEGEERLRLRWSGPGFRDQPLPPSVFGH